ncbi:MAG: Radical SAM superfamily protein [Candidatus Methanofastidiosum methylothiophilum]|uniref:Radical SAM superfamily protein n=1 Tax=Candidatus Methanofastidiosum methylothiophilum TaxID=1705564 RepID=A0A150IU33_9EURY|nr:MAG: Radical SAM superfamily protein [Candidatus Methanofastidiosum methylthiophilus]KYC48385.1 MAG: Radical SAM superfamily protein [Candidatus Methanofastidiosum methylthiophilus]KYC50750.1 MAG: Radical SAM superfamily protein [Candidatus Methanofastidiosum methylthiophilus]
MFFYNRENVQGKEAKALSIILPTVGCRWRRCNMCSYFEDSPTDSSIDTFSIFVDEFNSAYDNEIRKVKLFTSGSFLDPREVRPECAKKIVSFLSEKGINEVTLESRPEYVIEGYLKELMEDSDLQIEVAIGLESSNNRVLEHSINKGFTFEDYISSSKVLKKLDIKNKAYLIIKPPFLTEKEAIYDAINSAKAIENIADVISFNPMTVHKDTLVEYLWNKGEYSPPWAWSILKILKETSNLRPDIICHPVAFGRSRGPKNCKNCNRDIEKRILEFSLNNDPDILDYECDCKKEWEEELLKF